MVKLLLDKYADVDVQGHVSVVTIYLLHKNVTLELVL